MAQKNFSDILKGLTRLLPNELYRALNPGAPNRSIMLIEETRKISIPSSVRALYRWKDGAKHGAGFIPLFHFLPLDWVKSQIQRGKGYCPVYYFPIFDNGCGDFLFCDLREKRSLGLYLWRNEKPGRRVLAFDSLRHFFLTVADAWASGVFTLNKESHELVTPFAIQFREYHKRRLWNEIFCKRNPMARKAMRGLALLVEPSALTPPAFPKSGVFNDQEYAGLAGSFPNKFLGIHWCEFAESRKITSRVPKSDWRKELEWLDQVIAVLSRLLKNRRAAQETTERVKQLVLQVEFLEALRKAMLTLRTKQ